MFFECKASNVVLGDEHSSQLYRYFSVTRFTGLDSGRWALKAATA